MQVGIVLGRDEPTKDGVADYVHRLSRALEDVGVSTQVVPAAGRVRAAARELEGVDLVHVQFAPSAYGYRPGIGLLPHLVDAPLVTTLHEYGWWSWPARVPEAAWRAVERSGRWDRETLRLVPASRALVCTNDGHRRAVRARTRRDATRIVIGPNVDRVPSDRGATRARHDLPRDAPVAVFFGFVHPVKGVRYLLEALAELRATTHPDLHLVVAGGFESLALPGEEATGFEAELRRHAEEHGVADAVRWTGWVDAAEVSALLGAADVAALPFTHGLTLKSGSLLAVLDHGLPLVGTVGEGTEPALHQAGRLGPVRESAVLARHLREALDEGPRPAAAALAAQHRWDAIAEQHRDLYAGVLGRVAARA